MHSIFHLLFIYFHLSLLSPPGCWSYYTATSPLSGGDGILVAEISVLSAPIVLGPGAAEMAVQFSRCQDKFKSWRASHKPSLGTSPGESPWRTLTLSCFCTICISTTLWPQFVKYCYLFPLPLTIQYVLYLMRVEIAWPQGFGDLSGG